MSLGVIYLRFNGNLPVCEAMLQMNCFVCRQSQSCLMDVVSKNGLPVLAHLLTSCQHHLVFGGC